MKSKNLQHDKRKIKLVNKEQPTGIDIVVSRSLMKRLISLSGLGLVKGGAVSEAKVRRALRNNDKEISLDNKRPQMNGSKECQDSNIISRSRKGTRTFH